MSKPAFDIDCKRLYKLYGNSIEVSGSFLDKIKGAFKISPQKIGDVNAWTTFALAELYSACSVFRAVGDNRARTHYEETEKYLRDWLTEIAKVLAPYKQLISDATSGKQVADSEKDKVKKAVETTITATVSKKPKQSATPPANTLTAEMFDSVLATFSLPSSNGGENREAGDVGKLFDQLQQLSTEIANTSADIPLAPVQ